MSGQEMIVAIVAISIFGGVAITFIQSVTKVLEKRMDKNKSGGELDKKFFDDYVAFKNEVYAELEQLKRSNKSASASKSVDNVSSSKPRLVLEHSDEFDRMGISTPRLKNMLDQKK